MSRTRVIVGFVCLAAALAAVMNLLGERLEHVEIVPVSVWLALPFVLLLAAIALAPFIARHWWERNYPWVAFGLGAVVVLAYAFVVRNTPRLLHTSYEYVSFISLIGSLFVVSGGIQIRIRGTATPVENVTLLAFGAFLSNFIGTTGASMVLIRPYLRVNRYRLSPHHVVFFIFVVSNIGGALTPIGDPPLFLGYLKGIPFFWVLTRAWQAWAVAIGLVLLIFYAIDTRQFAREDVRLRHAALQADEAEFRGLHNLAFLAAILGAVFLPEQPRLLRETLMWAAALGSYYTTRPEVHRENAFNFLPVKEVAILFAGIFVTMVPALDWLQLHSRSLGIVTPGQYFWATGTLSSVLDNAPTYLNFLSAAFGLHGANVDNVEHLQAMLGATSLAAAGLPTPLPSAALPITDQSWRYVLAVSLGAVFFGANTYIGNGPNFMVKSISTQAGVDCPTFLGYVVKYSLPILIPVFVVVWLLFFSS